MMRSNFKVMAGATLAMFLGVGAVSTDAAAWGRTVVVNGQVMNGEQLAALDRAHCMQIPDGNYFLTQSADGRMIWGYAALPGIPQGYLGEECGGGQARQSEGSGSGGFGSFGSYMNTEEGSHVYGGGIPNGDGTFQY